MHVISECSTKLMLIQNVHSDFWSQLIATLTKVLRLLHDSLSFTSSLLTLDVDVTELELAGPTFGTLNGTVLHKFVFCTKLLSELAN